MNPIELNNSELDRSKNHISNVSNNIVNTNKNRLSIKYIDFINYYHQFFSLLLNRFYPLFYNLIYLNGSDLDNYISSIVSSYQCLLTQLTQLQKTLIPAAKNTYKAINCCLAKLKNSVACYSSGLKDLKCSIKKISIFARIPLSQIKRITAKLTVKYKINIEELKKLINSCICKIGCIKFECTELDSICCKVSTLKSCICSDINLLICLQCHMRNFNMFEDNVSRLKRFIFCCIPDLARIESCFQNILVDFNKDIEQKSKQLETVQSNLTEMETCVQKKLDALNKTVISGITINGINITHEMTVECSPPKLTQDPCYKRYKCLLDGQKIYFNIIKSDMDKLNFDDSIQKIKRGASSISELLFDSFIRCSLKALSSHVINTNVPNLNSFNMKHHLQSHNVAVNILSRIAIDYSIFVMSRLYFYYKIKLEIPEMLSMLEHCICIKVFDIYYVNSVCSYHRPRDFSDIDSINWYKIHDDIHNKENDSCLCKIIRYRLIPELYFIIRYCGYIFSDLLTTLSREFEKYLPYNNYKLVIYKSIFLAIRVILKITSWMRLKYSDDLRRGYCFCNRDDKTFMYLKLTIIRGCELIENCFTFEYDSIINEINFLSSLLSEYQSIHAYTNYYSPSLHNILPIVINGSTNQKSAKGSLSFSFLGVKENNKPSLVSSTVTTTTGMGEKNNESTTTTYAITTSSTHLLKNAIKGGFMSIRTMLLGTHFSKEGFALIYSKFSGLVFFAQNSNPMIKNKLKMRSIGLEIPLKYLNEICQQSQPECHCTKRKECKICPIAKIRLSGINISLNQIEVTISNASKDILLDYLIESVTMSEDFFSILSVGFTEVYTAMLKNVNLAHHENNHKNIANRFPCLIA